MENESFRLDDICKKLIGKTIVSLEYGGQATEEKAEELGERHLPLDSIIVNATISTTEGDRDPCIRLILKDDIEIEVYDNELLTVK